MNTTVWRIWYKIEYYIDPATLTFPFKHFLKPGWRHALINGKLIEYDSYEAAMQAAIDNVDKLPRESPIRILKVTEEVCHNK